MNDTDEHHEAYGAMIHRGLVETRNVVNHHQKHADALKCAQDALTRITVEYEQDYDLGDKVKVMSMIAARTLRDIERILK